jgi:hypothetical protein
MWQVHLISVKRQILTKGGGHGKIGFFAGYDFFTQKHTV